VLVAQPGEEQAPAGSAKALDRMDKAFVTRIGPAPSAEGADQAGGAVSRRLVAYDAAVRADRWPFDE